MAETLSIENEEKEMYQQEYKILSFAITNSSGVAKDLTSASAKWVLTGGRNGTAIITKTSVDGDITFDSNLVNVLLEETDTETLCGLYYYELRITDGGGKSEVVAKGNLEIKYSSTATPSTP